MRCHPTPLGPAGNFMADTSTATRLPAAEQPADAAATLIANAVTLDSPKIRRRPACDLDPDTDLGEHLVTVQIGPLSEEEIALALANGKHRAKPFRDRGLIIAAALMLRGRSTFVGGLPMLAGAGGEERPRRQENWPSSA